MTNYIVSPSTLFGSIELPTSKSHSIRAIIFASLAEGKSRLRKLLDSPDIHAALKACELFGAKITLSNELIEIEGTHGKFHTPSHEIDSGNSGQVLRFIGALAALGEGETTLTGDDSIKTNRPVKPLLEALNQLGAQTKSAEKGHAPISIKGPAHAERIVMKGEDSQPVSGILMLASLLKGTTEIEVLDAGEKPWIDLTLYWLRRFNVEITHKNYSHYTIKGPTRFKSFDYTVPGDFSSATFPVAAAFATRSKITLKNLDMDDVQGDKKFFEALEKMGARFEYDKKKKEMHVDGTQTLKGAVLDINDHIDSITILAVLGCLAEGTTEIINAQIARKKESDRIECITKELQKMNADIKERPDGLIIKKSNLKDATVISHHDHRIAMSLTIAGLIAQGSTIVQGVDCIKKSYPNFVEDLKHLGAKIEVR
jgi:3-phosphoshikimate 1-carboxyvinyltransferase